VERATPDDLKELQQLIERAQLLEVGSSFAGWDLEFHTSLYRTTKKRDFLLHGAVVGRVLHPRTSNPNLPAITDEEITQEVEFHTALVQAICARDAKAAEAILRRQRIRWQKSALEDNDLPE